MKAFKTLLLVFTVTLLGACGKKSNGSKANINRARGDQAKLTCTSVKEDNKSLLCQKLADLIEANEADGCKASWETAYNKNACTTRDGVSDEIDSDASETRVVGEQTDVGPEITAEIIDQGSNQVTVEHSQEAVGVAYSAKPLRTYTTGTTRTAQTQTSSAPSTGLQRLVVTRQQTPVNQRPVEQTQVQTQTSNTNRTTTTRREVVQLKPITIQAQTAQPAQQTQQVQQTQQAPVSQAQQNQVTVTGGDLQQLEEQEPGRFMIQRTVKVTDPQTGEVSAETTVEKITEESAPQSAEFKINVPSIRYEADTQTDDLQNESVSAEITPAAEAPVVQASAPMVQGFAGADNGECRKIEKINDAAVAVRRSLSITEYLNNLNQWSVDVCSRISSNKNLKSVILQQLGGRDISKASCQNELKSYSTACSQKVANGNASSDVFISK